MTNPGSFQINPQWDGSSGVSLTLPYCCAASFSFDASVHYPDMTAIVSAYTAGGFAIGGDGLRTDASGAVITTTARKVFPASAKELSCAYAWAGTTGFCYENRHFSLIDESARVAQELAEKHFFCLYDYAKEFIDRVNLDLRTYNAASYIPPSGLQNGNEIARVLFVGYVAGVRSRIEASLCRDDDGVLVAPSVTEEASESDLRKFKIFSGSRKIYDSLRIYCPESLNDAVNSVWHYIQTCAAHRDTEPECANIGGHIHVATVTPEGFKWAYHPE